MPINQTIHFANDLEALINRYRSEYDLTYAQLVGVLHIQTHLLCEETARRADAEQDEDDGE